ncbi:hypothetical protein JQ625_02665 [Bradyrhizobium diazoefficiens]|nr:hypothetical protein [Bradyrhizobium diazoefficiens]MBR0773724.1 hypothetical protein [Bradyrhizobium diazoefficiens]
MRKIVLVAAMVLASASVEAAGSRSLSLAAAEQTSQAVTTVATAQPGNVAPETEAPKYIDRPPAVSVTAPAATPAVTTTTPAPGAATAATKSTARADEPKRKRYWTEGRIIRELHRHGIYW